MFCHHAKNHGHTSDHISQLSQAGKLYAPPGKLQLIYFVDDLNMPALDKYNTQRLRPEWFPERLPWLARKMVKMLYLPVVLDGWTMTEHQFVYISIVCWENHRTFCGFRTGKIIQGLDFHLDFPALIPSGLPSSWWSRSRTMGTGTTGRRSWWKTLATPSGLEQSN